MKSLSRILPARRKSGGFSLLEVTVAVAILSIAIASIIQLYSMNLNNVRKAELYTQAVIIARSAMDETLSALDIEETNENETLDEIYELNTTITRAAGDEDDEEAIAQTYEIVINISWQGGAFELKSRKSILKSSRE